MVAKKKTRQKKKSIKKTTPKPKKQTKTTAKKIEFEKAWTNYNAALDMEKIKSDAKENKCSVFHQFCQNEFEEKELKK